LAGTEVIHILITRGITGLPVVDDQKNFAGIISEEDLLGWLHDPGLLRNPAARISRKKFNL
jgi:CBS domain-containing protein